jgi:hypothetical protein
MNTINKWSQPVILSDLDAAFGPSSEGMLKILPAWFEIPEDFRAYGGSGKGEAKKWVETVNYIFFNGVEIREVVMKPGVDRKIAMRQLQCVLHSYEPQHEHKTAGAAYLMSLWFEKFEYVKEKK